MNEEAPMEVQNGTGQVAESEVAADGTHQARASTATVVTLSRGRRFAVLATSGSAAGGPAEGNEAHG